MARWICFLLVILMIPVIPAQAQTLRWVDFDVPYESLKYAMEVDISTFEQEKHLDWVDVLALAGCRTGGKCGLNSVKKAVSDLKGDKSPEELLGSTYQYYDYYHTAYAAVLGGLLGSFAIEKDGEFIPAYGLKAFSPVAAGYGYSHCDDFGVGRSFGFKRKHLGNDLMGVLGTPIVAVEGGIVEAMGWNRYGGWRIGIRSADNKRYYNSETVHLHFGLQLVFDESQKECNSEIWVDVYDIVRLLSGHRSSIVKTADGWKRLYPYTDLDIEELYNPFSSEEESLG